MNHAYDASLRQRIVEHFRQTVGSLLMESQPFPHLLIRGFFPADVYDRLLTSFPQKEQYEPFAYEKHQTDGESNRWRFTMENKQLDRLSGEARKFWYTVRSALGSPELKHAIFTKLSPGLAFRYGETPAEARQRPGFALPELFRETKGYSIKPHPDTRKKVVTMQIALPRDDSQENLGTEFYRRSVNPRDWLREPRGFEVTQRMPFLPNTAYAFAVLNTFTLKSWHGKTAIPGALGERNSILNIWYEKAEHANLDVVAENEAANGARIAA